MAPKSKTKTHFTCIQVDLRGLTHQKICCSNISSVSIKDMKIDQETSEENLFKKILIDNCYQDLMGSSTQARSIKNYEFRISRSKIRPMLMYLFRIYFLTILDIYKAYF